MSESGPHPFSRLEQVKIARNCPADWNGMSGDARVRHCSQCKRNVYNLSEMTRMEALSLVQRTEGHLCARFYMRRDGKIMTQDCGLAARIGLRVAGIATALGLSAAVFWFSTYSGEVANPKLEVKHFKKLELTLREDLKDAASKDERESIELEIKETKKSELFWKAKLENDR